VRRLLFQMHALSSHCAVLPLVAAVLLLGAARIETTVQSGARDTAERILALPVQQDPDLALIDSVLAKRAPELGLVLRAQVSRAIAEEARLAGYDPLLILAIIDVESDFDPEAVSSRGARGLMQIQPATLHWFAQKQGLRLSRLGVRYLRSLQDRFAGDLSLALMAYNAGPDRIRQALRERGLEPFRFYPRRVKRDFERFSRGAGLGGDWAYAVRDPERAAR
jgi:soluble lytic murein transglycosylase-like protein